MQVTNHNIRLLSMPAISGRLQLNTWKPVGEENIINMGRTPVASHPIEITQIYPATKISFVCIHSGYFECMLDQNVGIYFISLFPANNDAAWGLFR